MKIPALIHLEDAVRRLKEGAATRLIHKMYPAEADAHFVIHRLEDHWMAFDPDDKFIGKSISQHGGWERPAFRELIASLRAIGHDMAGKVFVDVGANIGTQTVYSFLDGGFSSAVCVEPVPDNVVCLRANVAINEFSDRVRIIQGAAGSSPATVDIGLSHINSGGHSILAAHERDSISVRLDTVDSYLEEAGVHPLSVGMFWIDVEGFEREVLAGASSLLAAAPPLVLEFNARTYGEEAARNLVAMLSRMFERVGIISADGVSFRSPQDILSHALENGSADLVWVNAR